MLTKTVDGRKLAMYREDRGLTQAELAARLGDLLGRRVYTTTISKWENGQALSAKAWKAIAAVLEVDRNDLLTEALAS